MLPRLTICCKIKPCLTATSVSRLLHEKKVFNSKSSFVKLSWAWMILNLLLYWRHDTLDKDTHHNNKNATFIKMTTVCWMSFTLRVTFVIVNLKVVICLVLSILRVVNAGCCSFWVTFVLNVVMLSVVMLNVVAPLH